MNIQKIVLCGFGRHENMEIDFTSGLNILYGPNEAGKTTIKTAILHILFGFPQKNQQELRYEPKHGGKYGGCLYIEDREFGNWMIERVRGKSSGDVTIRYEDGRSAGEEELKHLLRGYDRHAFEAIFSFSMFQLQGLEKMDENDLSRTLLASGTSGLDTLWKIESKMDKELNNLFKKSGRVPPINQKLKELNELEQQMKKEQLKLAEYEPLMMSKKRLDEEIAALRTEEQNLHKRAEEVTAAMQITPLLQQKKRLEEQLGDLPERQFPADGIRRFEELASRKSELEIRKTQLMEEQRQLQQDQVELRPEAEQQQLERLAAQEAEWHRLRNDRLLGEQEIRLLEKKRQQFKQRLGLSEAELEAAETMDVSIPRERRLEPLAAQQEEAKQQLSFLQRMLAEAEDERSQAEQRKQRLAGEASGGKEKSQFTQQQKTAGTAATSKWQFAAIALIGIALSAYSVMQKQWLLLVLGLLTGACGLWLMNRRPQGTVDSASAARENEWQQNWHAVQSDIQRLDEKLEKLAAQLEQAHSDKQSAERTLKEALAEDPVDLLLTVQESFRQLRDYQDTAAELANWHERLAKGEQRLRTFAADITALIGPQPEDMLFESLRKELAAQKELREKQRNSGEQLSSIRSRLEENASQLSAAADEIARLFESAGVDEKERFYASYEQQQEVRLLSRQLAEADLQLSVYPKEQHVYEPLPQLESERSAITKRLQTIRKETAERVDEQVKIAHQLSELKTSRTYSELSQLAEMKKAELEQLAKQWTARKAVMTAIQKTMSGWKEHQLPAVLQQANEWFHRLTAGRYEQLRLTAQGYFEAVTESQQAFAINELSQATKEQAYLSLRLALASELINRAPFPIIMDDPFVHFDKERLSRMIELLNDLQPSHQFLYFTCHEEMKTYWQNAHVIEIGRKVKGEISG